MGEVFRAVDEQLGRPVAVKLMLPTDRDPRAVERFHREARSAAQLNDPHVVAVYDFGQEGDQFYLVMELVEGGTVASELAEHGPLPKDRAIDIVEQAAVGLAAAHRANVVHRDVKPGNLLLAPGGMVKVADFGIAHQSDTGATALTATGQLIGSALYLAPERAKGGQAGKPSDVYSLGCVLYQLLTGQPPFSAEHPAALLYQHVDAAPPLPSATRPELAGGLEAELLRMLAKDPAERPTAEAIAAGSLRTASLATTPLATTPLATAPVVAAGPVETTPLVPVSDTPPARPGRKKALLAGAGALVAVAAAVLVGVILNNNDPKAPTTDIGPGPGVVSSTPDTTATSSSEASQPSQPTRRTSTQPSQTPSSSNTPPPSSTPTTSAPTPTPTPSKPTQSPTPTATTTTPPTTAPSSTPPTEPPSSPPPSGTPSPDAQ